jgi:hypothetical protein
LLREGKLKVIDQLFYARQLGTSQASMNINADSNVLELFLINDAFHHFNDFILQETFVKDEGERIRILKAFAYYIGIFCNAIYHPEILVKETLVAEHPVEENLIWKFKRIIKLNKILYFIARKAVLPFRTIRNCCKVQKSQPDIGIPAVESQQGIRIPVIESYVLKNETQ